MTVILLSYWHARPNNRAALQSLEKWNLTEPYSSINYFQLLIVLTSLSQNHIKLFVLFNHYNLQIAVSSCGIMNNHQEIIIDFHQNNLPRHSRDSSLFSGEKYLKNSSPFIWWSTNYKKYPILRQLAKRYLSAPIGSVPSEREFKQAERVGYIGKMKPKYSKITNTFKVLYCRMIYVN